MTIDITTTITDTPTGLIGSQPQDVNFLSPLGFRFLLKRSPTLNFFATDANIPSVDIGYANLPTPFKVSPFPGDKPQFGDFVLTFKVDENLTNYLEMYAWICKIGFPDSFDQYASIRSASIGSGVGITSDGTLTILNSSMAPTTEVQFTDMFPYSLSEVDFTTVDDTVNYVTARVAFKFTLMKVVSLLG